jgi:hypothetical protein
MPEDSTKDETTVTPAHFIGEDADISISLPPERVADRQMTNDTAQPHHPHDTSVFNGKLKAIENYGERYVRDYLDKVRKNKPLITSNPMEALYFFYSKAFIRKSRYLAPSARQECNTRNAETRNLPGDWKQTRNRWEFFQGVRAFCCSLVLCCYV